MRTAAYLYTCALATGLMACGGGAGEIDEVYGPLSVHDADLTPGCYVDPPIAAAPEPGTAQAQHLAAWRSQREFRHAMMAQQALVLSNPIVEDPTAGRWDVELGRGVRVAGASLARGEGWGVVKMVATGVPAGLPSMSATIDVTPGRTLYTFENGELSQHANYVRVDEEAWGCHPTSGMSFAVGPAVVDGEIVADVRRCWWPSGLFVDGRVPQLPEEGEAGEFAASARIQCLQIIEKMLLD